MARKRRSGPRRKKKSGIYIKPGNKGKLRKSAKAKKGRKIPVSKLRAMKRSKNPKTRKRATFALNARKWRKGGKRKKK
jgi:oligoendopeptidase F